MSLKLKAIGGTVVAMLLAGCAHGTFASEAMSMASTSSGAPAAVPAAVADTVVDADPALWVVKDDDTTIYLFGTVHLLKPGLGWFDEAVKDSFAASDELRIEVVLPDDPAALTPIILAKAVDPAGKTMTSKLTEAQRTAYIAGMTNMGLPYQQVEPLEPWFVSLQVTVGLVAKAGFDPAKGVESILTAEAKAMGKPVTAFETAEEQFGFFDQTPESEQIAGLMMILSDPVAAMKPFDQIVAAWTAGKPEIAGDLLNESMAETPVTSRVLLTDRNQRWATWIKGRMAQPGSVFVAVGAGHLAGKDSVQDYLKSTGVKVSRVDY